MIERDKDSIKEGKGTNAHVYTRQSYCTQAAEYTQSMQSISLGVQK